jgi:hypothetical protein
MPLFVKVLWISSFAGMVAGGAIEVLTGFHQLGIPFIFLGGYVAGLATMAEKTVRD